jgi:hypothetical protein
VPLNSINQNQPTLKITNNETKLGFLLGYVRVMVFNATFNNIYHIVVVSFIGGGNRSTRRKPATSRKSLTNIIT